uniref:Mitochondrial assembly of ribosomal large subunit protein 1 n=1 Tax=Panstrongylus lignarius TaxID=156445 RepID=A0A224XJA1_9HEMI
MSISTLGICFKKLYRTGNTFVISKGIRCLSSDHDNSKRFTNKYRVFKDEDSDIIFDVEEERLKKQQEVEIAKENESISLDKKICGHSYGEIDVQELVDFVKSNKAQNVVVIKLPPDLKYANFMILTSGSSRRQINGIAELIRKHFKGELAAVGFPKMEGANSDWVAMDLGNIILHLMMDSVRKDYDLESLWAIGAKYDLKLNTKDDEVLNLLKSHSVNLDDLNPARNRPVQ